MSKNNQSTDYKLNTEKMSLQMVKKTVAINDNDN